MASSSVTPREMTKYRKEEQTPREGAQLPKCFFSGTEKSTPWLTKKEPWSPFIEHLLCEPWSLIFAKSYKVLVTTFGGGGAGAGGGKSGQDHIITKQKSQNKNPDPVQNPNPIMKLKPT